MLAKAWDESRRETRAGDYQPARGSFLNFPGTNCGVSAYFVRISFSEAVTRSR